MTEEQNMTPEQRQFEEAIIDMAVAEHHKYCMVYKRAKSEKDARMFYTAFKLGVTKGMQYATNKIIEHNLKVEEENGNNR
jgi:hypothetical protein